MSVEEPCLWPLGLWPHLALWPPGAGTRNAMFNSHGEGPESEFLAVTLPPAFPPPPVVMLLASNPATARRCPWVRLAFSYVSDGALQAGVAGLARVLRQLPVHARSAA